jgi:hypothetical protein
MASLDTLRGVVRDEPGIERSYEDRAELPCAWDFDPERELRVMQKR